MKNIDKLYKQILLAQGYTEIPELALIFKSCRLKPYSIVFENAPTKIELHRWWIDEFGNSVKIVKKKIEIIYNDLLLDGKKIISTDLYYGLSVDKIVKISKLAHIFIADDYVIITLLGIDNYLRSYLNFENEVIQVSPLLLGLENLKLIFKNSDIKYFMGLPKKENTLPCKEYSSWLTSVPANNIFIKLMERQSDIVSTILTNNIKDLNV